MNASLNGLRKKTKTDEQEETEVAEFERVQKSSLPSLPSVGNGFAPCRAVALCVGGSIRG
jgi:hypothetical protein